MELTLQLQGYSSPHVAIITGVDLKGTVDRNWAGERQARRLASQARKLNFQGLGRSPWRKKDHLKLYDAFGRPLVIELEREEAEGGARKVRCHAGVWLVNKAGLPLAFRRRVGGAGKVAQHRSVGEEVDFDGMRGEAAADGAADSAGAGDMGDANHLAAHAPPSGPDDDNSLLTGLGQEKLRIHTAQRFTRSLHSASVIGDMDDDDADADGCADADADADELGGELLHGAGYSSRSGLPHWRSRSEGLGSLQGEASDGSGGSDVQYFDALMSGDEGLRTGQVAMLSWSASNIFDESISLRLVAPQQYHGDQGDQGGHQGGHQGDGGDCDGDRQGATTPPGDTHPSRHGPWSERVNVLASRPQHIALYEAKPSRYEVTPLLSTAEKQARHSKYV